MEIFYEFTFSYLVENRDGKIQFIDIQHFDIVAAWSLAIASIVQRYRVDDPSRIVLLGHSKTIAPNGNNN